MSTRRNLSAVVVAIVFASQALTAQTKEPWNFRPMTAKAIMSSPKTKRYNGVMQRSEVAKICGEVPADRNFSGLASFIIQFPDDLADGEITDVTFGSNELTGGKLQATKFMLNLSFKKPPVSPLVYVLDTNRPGNSGSATLVKDKDGTLTLTIKGSNEDAESVEFTATCKPRV